MQRASGVHLTVVLHKLGMASRHAAQVTGVLLAAGCVCPWPLQRVAAGANLHKRNFLHGNAGGGWSPTMHMLYVVDHQGAVDVLTKLKAVASQGGPRWSK